MGQKLGEKVSFTLGILTEGYKHKSDWLPRFLLRGPEKQIMSAYKESEVHRNDRQIQYQMVFIFLI